MFEKLIDIFVRRLYGDRLWKEAEKRSEQNDAEAGRYAAARYTRGNIAIQQGRYSDSL